jgi:hypothetical protein
MSFLCFKKLVSTAVLGPMAVMPQCKNGELFSNPTGREIGQDLIFEAWSVIRRYLPYIKLDQVSGWVIEVIAERGGHLHPILLEALTGRETDIDDINGWIIDQAHQYGLPCDRHEGMRDLVKARTEEIKKEMEAMEAAKRVERNSQRDTHPSRDSQSEIEPLDKLEVKKMEKAKRQREQLGNQEVPDYASPNILPLGKKGK